MCIKHLSDKWLIIFLSFLFQKTFSFIYDNNKKIIYTSYSNYQGAYKIFLFFNQYTCTSVFLLNLERNYSCFGGYMYPDRCQKDKKEIEFIQFSHKKYNVVECWGNPDLSHFPGELQNLTFYTMKDDIPTDAQFFVGFSYKFEDEKYSIIHQMYNSNTILKRRFALVPDRYYNNKNGTFFFGDIPEELIANKKRGKCSINENYHTWGCNIDKIIIGNNIVHTVNQYAHFSLSNNNIFVPSSFFSIIERDIFSNYLKNFDCKKEKTSNKLHFYCTDAVLHNFPDIQIVFDKVKLKIPTDKLFRCDFSSECDFLIINRNDYDDHFIIGTPLLDSLDLLFDYDDKSLTFFSNEFIEGGLNGNGTMIKKIYIIIIISLVLNTVLLTYIQNYLYGCLM